MMTQHIRIKHSTSFQLMRDGRWEDLMSFLMRSTKGREEASQFGTELLYVAVEYRAPASLITLIFNIIENAQGGQMTLNSKLLLKALYFSPKDSTDICFSTCDRRWEKRERGDVANFLSSKINAEANSAA